VTAVVETLGFTRRQVSTSVAWQATTVGAVVVMLVGLPVGVGVALVLLIADVVAFVPGRIAARLRPVIVLGSE